MLLRGVVVLTLALGIAFPASSQPVSGVSGISGGLVEYTVGRGDTLRGVSARFGVDADVIAAENQLEPGAKLTPGQQLRIDNRHIVPAALEPGVLIVNIPQRMLFYGHEASVAAVPIAVGKPTWRTPERPFTVQTKEVNPSWEVPASIQAEARRAGRSLPPVVPPGPKNPLGKFWLGLSISGVGIHGTNQPSSIYRAGTHGCIRVGPDDIAWLFPRVAIGARGLVIYEPILLTVVGLEIFLEVHHDVYGRQSQDPLATVRAMAEAAGLTHSIDWTGAQRVLAERHGVARVVGTWRNSLFESEGSD